MNRRTITKTRKKKKQQKTKLSRQIGKEVKKKKRELIS